VLVCIALTEQQTDNETYTDSSMHTHTNRTTERPNDRQTW